MITKTKPIKVRDLPNGKLPPAGTKHRGLSVARIEKTSSWQYQIYYTNPAYHSVPVPHYETIHIPTNGNKGGTNPPNQKPTTPLTPYLKNHLSKLTIPKLTWYAYRSSGLAAIQYTTDSTSPTGYAFIAHFNTVEGVNRFGNTTLDLNIGATLHKTPYLSAIWVFAPPPAHTKQPRYTGNLIPISGGAKGLSKILKATGLAHINTNPKPKPKPQRRASCQPNLTVTK